MAKPGKNVGRNSIFTEIGLKIMLINEQIKNHRKSIEKVKRMSGWQGPAGASGVDYSRLPGSGTRISFAEGLRMVEVDEMRIQELVQERAKLRRSMKRIEKIYGSLDGLESEVFYYRVIQKMTQAEAAAEIAISQRQLQRVEAGMRSRGLL